MPSNFTQAPIIDPIAKEDIEKEINALSAEAKLITEHDFAVYLAKANDIPQVLQELGRLREITFRAIGEGTGRECDLDKYDSSYLHLFVYALKEKKIIAAYRLGLTDKLDLADLYVASLFNISASFMEKIHPAIELGRAFVISEYQNSSALTLLWKGIGKFMQAHPHYISLLGMVSISQNYQAASRDLIVYYIQKYLFSPTLSQLVTSKNPYQPAMEFQHIWQSSLTKKITFKELNHIIRMIEPDHKSLPVLLELYYVMGTRFCAVNIDHDFNDALDILSVSYMQNIPREKLHYFMGHEAAEHYLAKITPSSS